MCLDWYCCVWLRKLVSTVGIYVYDASNIVS